MNSGEAPEKRSSLRKILECRVVGQWLKVLEEVPERRAQVAEPQVVHKQEAD